MDSILIDVGISALLRIVKSRQERHKWARALAKVFNAIRVAAESDSELATAIKSGQVGQ